jgi:hypothetical protein
MSSLPLTGLLFGIVLGLRHALEPDHLTAIATILTETGSVRRTMQVGVAWGIGHCASILAVVLVLTVLRTHMPARLEELFELFVAIMLLLLGARSLRRAFLGGVQDHACSSAPPHVHLGHGAFAIRSLVMGLVHGLAGSGLLTAMVSARFPGVPSRLIFVALFGVGATVGMAVLSGLLGGPLARAGRKPRVAQWMAAGAGALSTVFGFVWGVPVLLKLLR